MATEIPPNSSIPQIESVIPLNLPISTKLSHTNFLTWKSQILPVIKGYNLGKYIDATQVSNGDFSERQDQLILAWIRSSLTEPIQAQVVSCDTTADLWSSLTQIFSATSRARLTDLRRQLQTTTKGSSTCSEYLQRMRQISDELAFIGSPLSDDDLVSSVLNGLGAEFNPFVIAVTTASRHSPLSFSDLHGLLLSHEHLLQGQTNGVSIPSLESPAAFTVRSNQPRTHGPVNSHGPANSYRYHAPQQHHPFQGQPRPHQQRPPSLFGPAPQPRPQSANSYANYPSQPRPSYPGPKPQCQICMKIGHTAKICYYRFSADREDSNSAQNPSTFHAYLTQPSENQEDNSEWILDSGATNHVTSDINNLASFYAYEGTDNLQIGNGYPHEDYSSSEMY